MKSFTIGGEDIHIDINSHNAKGKGKNVMAGKKRKVSKKTLAALKRGRAKLAKMRKIRPIGKKRVRLTRLNPSDRERIRQEIREKTLYGASREVRSARPLSKEGATVAKHKRTRRKSSRVHGLEGRKHKRHSAKRLHGAHRRRRHSGRLMGGLNIGGIKKQVVPLAAGIAGAAVAAVVLKKLPEKMNPMVKAGVPLAAGIASSLIVKNPMIAALGMGMSIIGGYALARQALPNFVPELSGVEDTVHAAQFPLGEIANLEDLRGEVRQLGSSMDLGDIDGDDLSGYDGDDLSGDMEGDDLSGDMEGDELGVDAL